MIAATTSASMARCSVPRCRGDRIGVVGSPCNFPSRTAQPKKSRRIERIFFPSVANGPPSADPRIPECARCLPAARSPAARGRQAAMAPITRHRRQRPEEGKSCGSALLARAPVLRVERSGESSVGCAQGDREVGRHDRVPARRRTGLLRVSRRLMRQTRLVADAAPVDRLPDPVSEVDLDEAGCRDVHRRARRRILAPSLRPLVGCSSRAPW